MTVITMIAGMIPLIIAGGAGANGNRALALGVVGGMSIGTIALLFITPAFFIIFQTLEEKVNGSAPKVKKAPMIVLLVLGSVLFSSCRIY